MTPQGTEVHFQYVMIPDTTKQPSVRALKMQNSLCQGADPALTTLVAYTFFFPPLHRVGITSKHPEVLN